MPLTKTVESKRNELVPSARLLGENLSRRAFGERGSAFGEVHLASGTILGGFVSLLEWRSDQWRVLFRGR